MAENGSFNTNAYSVRYLTFNWWITNRNSTENWIDIGWNLVGAGGSSTKWYKAGNFKVVIDGEQVYYSSTRINLYNGTVVASGNKRIYGASNKTFSASAEAGIYTVAVNCRGSGSWTLPTLAVNPTLPTWINVSGSNGNWVNKNDPKFNVSWGGATSRYICYK